MVRMVESLCIMIMSFCYVVSNFVIVMDGVL
jgi:hypothetical protein